MQEQKFLLRHEGKFLGSMDSPEGASVIILGAPLDGTASYMPGSRFAPAQIRRVSDVLEEYSPKLDRELQEVPFYDAGDVDFALGNVKPTLSTIRTVVEEEILARQCMPIVLGGEHLITLPVVEAVYARHKDLAVVHFDAHADLRGDYLGEAFSHATVMRRLCDMLGPGSVYQFGIRSGTREEFVYGKENTRFFPYEIEEPLRAVLPELSGRPIYITIDIDVIDPGFAPGTGTPEPGGCTPQEMINAIHQLVGMNVVGFDVVEVCPLAETGVATSVLAAKLVREAILAFGGS